jgi:spore maturation protein CgeB
MKVLCVFGRHNYGDPSRGEGYEYCNFIPALRRLGHEILFFENRNRSRFRDFKELNEALLRTVEEYRPDVIFAVQTYYELWLETWKILRNAGIAATVNWATDDSWRYNEFSRFVAPVFHAFTTTYPDIYARYQRDGIFHVLLTQWATNAANLQPPLRAAECEYPVSFVGTAHGKRRAWIEFLGRRGINVACFGQGWPNGPVAASDIPRIISESFISLNFSNSALSWKGIIPYRSNQIKARTFEVPGAGGFLLTEWSDGLDRYYIPGKEIEVFKNIDELEDKIHFYLEHPADRDEIAQAGFHRTRSQYTYDLRLAEVLEFALAQGKQLSANRGISATGRIDWDEFEEAAQRHTMDRKLLYLKRALVGICSVVWGPLRGPRAARRFTFELSWRLVGSHTYSAAGLPGRMFYEVS